MFAKPHFWCGGLQAPDVMRTAHDWLFSDAGGDRLFARPLRQLDVVCQLVSGGTRIIVYFSEKEKEKRKRES